MTAPEAHIGDKPCEGPEMQSEEVGASLQIANEEDFQYITGWRLHIITFGLVFALFLANFEITLVGTALVAIANDLNNFSQTSWIVTVYLITYTTGLVIVAKLSDFYGRKTTCIASLLFFICFSAGCGASQTIVQLIVCRAFQGIGGSGIYSVVVVMIHELVPPQKYPLYTALVTISVVLAFALGPLFGGLVAEGSSSSWRWVFLLNVPAGAVAGAVLFVAVPFDFPYQNTGKRIQRPRMKEIDFSGAVLFLAALALLITGLEQAATLLVWKDASVLAPICTSAIAWLAFLANEWYSSRPDSTIQPVLPWRFCANRVNIGLLFNSFVTGAVSVALNIQLPICYQTVVGSSPFQAGLRQLPFSAVGPIATIIVAVLSKGRKVAPIYLAFGGIALEIIGLSILVQGTPTNPDWSAIYGTQVLIGMGTGMNIGIATLIAPFVIEKRDLAVGSAAVVQFRFFGGAVAVSITTAVGNNQLRNKLAGSLTSDQISTLFRSTQSIKLLPPTAQELVRASFIDSFNLQMYILLGLAVVSTFATALLWQRPQVKIP
ncbi:major facilitator superfamily domain-containing protein [Xylariomycetidae sp. FL2044]|nr:major facilitator superfamily domain-containing protein [Xylariomycetidae sp. FL2044]